MSRSLRMSHADPFADSPTVEVLEPHLAVGSHQEDAVTRRRILAALPEDIAAPGSGGRPVVVLAVDLAATEATKAIRAAREATSDAAVVVVTPPGGDSEVRRALRAGARGVVFAGEVEQMLAPAVNAVAAGLVAVPHTLRNQVVEPVFSHREREVLALVVEGATNREIANRLYLAESTVKSHLSTAFSKLGVHSRAEAATLLLDGFGRAGDDESQMQGPPAGGELALGATGSMGGSI